MNEKISLPEGYLSKLENPEKYFSDKSEVFYTFCKYAATRLPSTLTPEGFIFMVSRVIDDTQSSTGLGKILGYDGAPIPEILDGHAKELESEILNFANILGSPEFTEKVKKLYE